MQIYNQMQQLEDNLCVRGLAELQGLVHDCALALGEQLAHLLDLLRHANKMSAT